MSTRHHETLAVCLLLAAPFASAASSASAASAPAWAQADAPTTGGAPEGRSEEGTPSSSAGSEDDAREARRLLYLATGQVLRAESRFAEGAWQVRSRRDWTALSAGWVQRVRLEKDALREAKLLERELGSRASADQRAGHATWLLETGLYTEAAAEFDRVLRTEPDQARALEALRARPLPLALPPLSGEPAESAERLEEFLRAAAGLSPVGREVAVLKLAEATDGEARLTALRAELATGTNRRRAFAALALKRLHPGQALEPLLARAVLDGSEDVRLQASLALRAADNPALVAPVVRALGSNSSLVRSNAAQALGQMGYMSAVPALIATLVDPTSKPAAAHVFVGNQKAYIQDFDVEIANSSSIADPEVNVLSEGAVLDVRVLGISSQSASSAAAVRRSLASLTGASPGNTTAAWKRWWQTHEQEWRTRANEELEPPRTGK